jgi:hypothetical protein
LTCIVLLILDKVAIAVGYDAYVHARLAAD